MRVERLLRFVVTFGMQMYTRLWVLFVSEGCVCYFAYGMRHSEIAIVPEVMALPEEEQGLIDRRSSDGNRDLRHVSTESVSPLRI